MTEQEWLTSTDAAKMLHFAMGKEKVRPVEAAERFQPITDRKLRLFACACCRQAWDKLTDPRSRKCVVAAEEYADGLGDRKRLQAIGREASWTSDWPASSAKYLCLAVNVLDAIQGLDVAYAIQVALLRDIIGNPFRPIKRAQYGDHAADYRVAYSMHTVYQLAQSIYDDRTFERLPILADALEEAGCRDAAILEHCRRGFGNYFASDGTDLGVRNVSALHARGCWALDLILGKE